jgi:uncharacterized FAD-dependent dehydrogenase
MTDYDVIIVGGGPAGLFAAYELCTNSGLRTALIDKGKRVERRTPEDLMCGIGGSGLFTDGKLGFTPIGSLEILYDFLPKDQVQVLIDEVERTFVKFGMDADVYPKEKSAMDRLMVDSNRVGIELKIKKIRHIGSDNLPGIIRYFQDSLLSQGVDIIENTWVKELIVEKGEIEGVKTDDRIIKADNVILAPGRAGSLWMDSQVRRHKLGKANQPILVGIRVEVPSSILEKVTDVLWEPFFYIRTSTFDDTVRTYCTCPYGYVTRENYENFVAVNGHSSTNEKSPNSNFALLSKVALTEPVEDTISYGKSIAFLTTTIGGGRPIIQRFSDLEKGRRSTWERIRKSYVEPTLRDVIPGDISMALPHRVVTNLKEALVKLDELIPGVASGSTLLYAPEIKLTSARINTNKDLQTAVKGLLVAGDGAGVSGNIVGASATGILAARGILKEESGE